MQIIIQNLRKTDDQTYGIMLRRLSKLRISKNDIPSGSFVVCKDYLAGETLIATITMELTPYDGNLYEHFINLDISTDTSVPISNIDKDKIMEFVSRFALPTHNSSLNPFSADAMGRKNPNFSNFKGGDYLNCLFIPYVSHPQNKSAVPFFNEFQNRYVEFKMLVNHIQNDQPLDHYNFAFNKYLSRNFPFLNPLHKNEPYSMWNSESCLHLCYLELYAMLTSKASLKICIHCEHLFESHKRNEFQCKTCRRDHVYRKKYHAQHRTEQNEKNRIRMQEKRDLQKT